MDKKKRERLEQAGFRVGDAADFLGLTEEERQLVELRVLLARRVREQRQSEGLTQEELARRMRSSQSRVAKIETAEPGVSLDLSFRAFFAAGGVIADLASDEATRPKLRKRRGSNRDRTKAKLVNT